MSNLTIIDGHDLGDHIAVLDRMGEETHYIDLRQLVGISIGPGDDIHLRYNAGTQTLHRVDSNDAEQLVTEWVQLNKPKTLTRRKAG